MHFYKKTLLIGCAALLFSCASSSPKEEEKAAEAPKEKIIELKTVKIGAADWTVENLNTEKFRNGDPIPEAKTNEEWIAASKAHKAAWCYYDNNPENAKYGKLYNWYALTDERGLAPNGYHIPSVQEIQGLRDAAYGDYTKAGKKLKATEGWDSKNGDNESGFNAMAAGGRTPDGEFINLGKEAYFWSKDISEDGAEAILLIGNDDELRPYSDYKGSGFSVRIIRNKE